MSAHQAQKVQVVFPFKEDGIAIVTAIVEMVVMVWLEREIPTWHREGLMQHFKVPISPPRLPSKTSEVFKTSEVLGFSVQSSLPIQISRRSLVQVLLAAIASRVVV